MEPELRLEKQGSAPAQGTQGHREAGPFPGAVIIGGVGSSRNPSLRCSPTRAPSLLAMIPQHLFPRAYFRPSIFIDIILLSLPCSPKIFPVKAKGTKALAPGGMSWSAGSHFQVHC